MHVLRNLHRAGSVAGGGECNVESGYDLGFKSNLLYMW